MSPARRRQAVGAVQQRLCCSERRVCRATQTARSTQRYSPLRPGRDRALVAAIYDEVRLHPRYGYRMVTAQLRAAGWQVNAKRVYRLWRREGLRVARRVHKNKAQGESANSCAKRPARHKDDVWAMDFIHDSTVSGAALKLLVVEDEYTKECLALLTGGAALSGGQVAGVLAELFTMRAVPNGIRNDNGPEFTGRAVQGILSAAGVEPLPVQAGSPWENGVVESLNAILRDELLNTEMFQTVKEAREMTTAWRLEYNHSRPHGALGYVPPAVFALSCKADPGLEPVAPRQPAGDVREQAAVLS